METGPSSLWDFLEVHAVDGVNDIQRGAAIHCQLAGSNQRRPLGLYTNSVLSTITHALRLAITVSPRIRSTLRRTPATLLPVSLCARSTQGSESREEFHSSSLALGEQFWWWCAVPFLDSEDASLRVGETAHAAYSGPPGSLHSHSGILSALALPSFSSASSSKHGLFAHWREGNMTRPLLVDDVGPDMSAKYFSGAATPSGGTGTPLRTTVVG